MRRKLISIDLIIVMIIGLFALSGCNNKKENELDPNKEYVKINIPENGSTVNNSMYVILDENIIKYKTSEKEDDSKYKDDVGYSLDVEYYFEGIKEGNTEIWVIDLNPGETRSIIKYEISVDSNLNAKIINSPEKQYKKIKCGYLDNVVEESQVIIDDKSIARDVNIVKFPNEVNIVGIREGNTTMTIRDKDNTEKKYTVKVDANLNVELEEM